MTSPRAPQEGTQANMSPITLIAAVKNDGPFLLEWVAYHRLIGFERIVIFAQSSSDASWPLLEALAQTGEITLIENSDEQGVLPPDHRMRAYHRALDMVRDDAWVMALDTDEFVNVAVGGGTVADLIKATPDATAISLTWRIFGQGGERRFEDKPVLPRFTWAAPAGQPRERHHAGIKTLFKPNSDISRLRPHRPVMDEASSNLKWVDGDGADVTAILGKEGWSLPDRKPAYAHGQINKYPIRSAEVFLLTNHWEPEWRLSASSVPLESFAMLNAFEERDTSISRWQEKVTTNLRALMDIPAIAAGHAQTVAAYQAAIETMYEDVPQDWKQFLPVQPVIISEQAALKHRDLRQANPEMAPQKQQPTLVAPQPSPAVAPEPIKAEKPQAAPEPETPPEETPAAVDEMEQAPRWLADLRRSEYRRGFYHSDEFFATQFTDRGEDVLMVSFDNLSNIGDKTLTREGWGYSFYRAEGWSHLGVMAFERNWYRDEALFDYMEDLAAKGFFARFNQVVFTGTSMGAYASAAFSKLSPGSTVIAFSPQATLDERLVPWEKRFGSGRKQNWDGRYRDSADCVAEARHAFIIYDPYFEPDKLHAERYQGPNVHHLKSWYASHKTALFMNRAEILKPVVRSAVAGTLDPLGYYTFYRERRKLPWYLNGLRDHLQEAGHEKLVAVLGKFLVANGREKLGDMMLKRLETADK